MSSENPVFHRWIDPAGRGAPQGTHAVTTNEAERAALARWLDVPSLPSLSADLAIRRNGVSEAEVSGTIHAEVELVCGVSLENFQQRFEVPVQAVFQRTAAQTHKEADSAGNDPELDLEADEPREWTQHGIDLGALIAEELSLALPDFPRKPGAELPSGLDGEEEDAPPNPFAVLKGLTDKP